MSDSGNAHQLFKWNGEVNARHTRTRECKRGQAREKEWTERGGKKIYAIGTRLQISYPPSKTRLEGKKKERSVISYVFQFKNVHNNYSFFNNSRRVIF